MSNDGQKFLNYNYKKSSFEQFLNSLDPRFNYWQEKKVCIV